MYIYIYIIYIYIYNNNRGKDGVIGVGYEYGLLILPLYYVECRCFFCITVLCFNSFFIWLILISPFPLV